MPRPARRPRRAESVRRNDEAIREAVIGMTADEGWDAVTMSGVAKNAGLTVGAVYARADSVAELAIDAWSHELHEWFVDRMEALYAAQSTGDGKAVRAVFKQWDNDPVRAMAVTELILAALFDDELAEVIGADVTANLSKACIPDGISERDAAAHLLAISFLFGHLLRTRASGSPPALPAAHAANLAAYAVAKPRHVRATAPPLVWQRSLDDLDGQDAELMRATEAVVARVGYRRATFSRIARQAGMTRGSVTGRYPDKASLVADAAYHLLIPPGEVWSQYSLVARAKGPLESRALFLRSFLDPVNKPRWEFNLELARAASDVPELSDFAVRENSLERTHLGVMLAASFLPDVSELPFYGCFLAGINT